MTDLNRVQREVIAHYNAYNVPGQWFVGRGRDDGSVEVLYVGSDFVWSLLILPNGDHHSSEAELGEFSMGITV